MAIRFNPLGIGFSVSPSSGGGGGGITSVNGDTGPAVTLDATDVNAANQTLSNLTSPIAINQFLLPNGNNTQEIGSNSLQFANVTSRKLSTADSSGVTRGVLDGSIVLSSASSTAITGALQLPHASGAAFAVQTQTNASADAVATNPLYFETGSKTNAGSTGSTGLIQFRTGSSEGGNSGSLEFVTGGVNAGNSGSMNFTTGSVVGGTRGAMTFNASGLTVNTSTINITGEFSNHLKSQFSSLTVGTTSAPFGTYYAASGFNLISSGVDRLKIDNTTNQFTPYGLLVNTSIHRPYQDSANRSLGIFTDSDSTVSAVGTGDLIVGTGNKTAGTGSSGSLILSSGDSSGSSSGNVLIYSGSANSSFSGTIELRTGGASSDTGVMSAGSGNSTSGNSGQLDLYSGSANIGTSGSANLFSGDADTSGDVNLYSGNGTTTSGAILLQTGTGATRGQIKFVDGTEGTAGHVWTSIGTGGQGSWAQLNDVQTVNTDLNGQDMTAIDIVFSKIGRNVTMIVPIVDIAEILDANVTEAIPAGFEPLNSIDGVVVTQINGGSRTLGTFGISNAGVLSLSADIQYAQYTLGDAVYITGFTCSWVTA